MSGLHFGVRFWTPKRGPFCRQNFSHRRKIARVSIVSARTRQKFSMPLLFHGFAAPQALVLHTLRTFTATHVLELSRTCVGINVRRAWRTIARGAAKPWEPSGTAVCETSVAYLRKQSKLALFFDRRQKFCRQTAPVLGSRNGPQNGGQVVRTQANQIETE